MAKKRVFALKNAKKRKQKAKVDEFDEYVEGVEHLNGPLQTVEGYLTDWRNRLEKMAADSKTSDPTTAWWCEKALHHLAFIKGGGSFDYPAIVVFESTIQLGRCFEHLKFTTLIEAIRKGKKGQSTGGKNSAPFTNSSGIQLLKLAYNNKARKDPFARTAKELADRHGLYSKRKSADRKPTRISARTIKRTLKKLGILDNSSVVE